MYFKKQGGNIFGVTLSKKEQAALDKECARQFDDWVDDALVQMDAALMLTMHHEFGFGAERLKRYYKAIRSVVNKLHNDYEFDQHDDMMWLYAEKLKQATGLDIEEVRKEL